MAPQTHRMRANDGPHARSPALCKLVQLGGDALGPEVAKLVIYGAQDTSWLERRLAGRSRLVGASSWARRMRPQIIKGYFMLAICTCKRGAQIWGDNLHLIELFSHLFGGQISRA